MADMAFFEVWQDDTNKVLHYRRIASPRDKTNVFHAIAYFDADLLDAAVAKSNGKITRSTMPGDWALKQVLGDAEGQKIIDTHKNDYTIAFV